jgi:hypothetical protein
VIGVEPEASPVLSGGAPGPHRIQGIGAGFVPAVLDRAVLDEIMTVLRRRRDRHGATPPPRARASSPGISCGAALWAALEVAQRPESRGKRIVTVPARLRRALHLGAVLRAAGRSGRGGLRRFAQAEGRAVPGQLRALAQAPRLHLGPRAEPGLDVDVGRRPGSRSTVSPSGCAQ